MANTTVSGITEATGRTGITSAGRGSQGTRGRGSGGRGRGRGTNRPARTNFKGDTEGMNANVFECFEEQTDRRQFAKTREALEAYAKKTLKFAEDLAPLFADEMEEPQLELPLELDATASAVERAIWDQELREFVKRKGAFRGNLATIQAVILGQCSETMKDKLKCLGDFKAETKQNNCLWLLQQIRSITLQFDEKKNGFISIMNAQRSFLNCKQQTGQSPAAYRDDLRAWAITITQQGGSIAANYELIPAQDEDGNNRSEAERRSKAYEKTLAIALITGSDPSKYGTLTAHLSNQYAMGRDEYPSDETAAYNLLVNYRTPANIARPRHVSQNPTTPATASSGMTFTQHDRSIAGNNGLTHDGIECYQCHGFGHYASNCPDGTTGTVTGTTLTQFAFMLAQTNSPLIDPQWILLDSQSTISVFNNPAMLTNIRKSGHTLRALTNGGHQDSEMIGDFHNLGSVWYNPHSIANILSLSDVRKVCRVTLDTSAEPALCVHRINGSIMKFVEHASGLYVYDSTIRNRDTTSSECVNAYTMVSTVATQKRLFSTRQIAAADTARALYRKLGRPGEAEFYSILTKNLIRNCPVTPDDARRATHIYGPDVATLKGKMTRTAAAPRAPTFEAVPLPAPITEHHRNVTLCVDFFFVQGIGFLHTISRGIGFRTVSPILDRTRQTILRELTTAINLYTSRGLTVRDIHADNEFDCIRETIRPIELNIVPADSHVGEVERSIRTIKERLRSCVHGLPFRRLPKLMITHIVSDAVRCLNQFPHATGISSTMSPLTIVTGSNTPDYNAMRLELGTYVQVFEDHDPTNTPRSRSLGAIALCPTGNAQGDYYFLSLSTGARISRHNWTVLPLSDTAIARVEALALHEGRPLIQERGLVIEWRPDHPIDDAEYDLDFPTPTDAPDDVFEAADYDPIDPHELADLHFDPDGAFYHGPDFPFVPPAQGAAGDAAAYQNNNNEQGAAEDAAYQNNNEQPEDDFEEAEDLHGEDFDEEQGFDDEAEHAEAENFPEGNNDQLPDYIEPEAENFTDNNDQDVHVEQDEHEPPIVEPPYNLRPRAPAQQSFKDAMDTPHDRQSYYPPTQLLQQAPRATASPTHLDNEHHFAFNFVLKQMAITCTQMSERAGLIKHGKAAEAALMTEFSQLEDLDVYEAIDPAQLTRAQKKAALRAINLFKEKRNGKLKGRTCADGRSQRNLYDKSQTASPTVSTDALMLSIIIEAFENRDVATADVAGAYLKASMDDFVVMKFVGTSVKILCKLNPNHQRFVTTENGVDTLYVRLIQALYGCVKSALLWYDLFRTNLKDMGFKLNPYDHCVANCMIEGTQCTIAWYVDDTKISHVNPNVVTNIIQKLEERFDKMTVTRGREHVFLGMKIRYTNENTAVITMKDYLREAITESGLEISKSASTPANRTLFEVDETAEPLGKHESEAFHSVSAKLLYVSLRARVDLLLPIAFLCTRVSKSTKQDLLKLKRVLEYIKGSMDLEYTVGADDLGKIRTWVDASYAVHPDMKSHTGGAMSFGRGGILCKSTKQKLNTKSSTEAEFVGASDYLPNTIWVKNFLEAQGYNIGENVFEQDNESAMKLEKNGRMSAGPKSRHINIRYFWMKDRIKSEGITIRHCPTLQMVGDFFTKPLQGNLFRKFRSVIMGATHMDTLAIDQTMPIEERVGIKQSCNSTTDHMSNHNSTGTSRTVLGTGKERSVSWADIVKGVRHAHPKERVATDKENTKTMFREIILSKQSSNKSEFD